MRAKAQDRAPPPIEVAPLQTTLVLAGVAALSARIFRQRLDAIRDSFEARPSDQVTYIQLWADAATRQVNAQQNQIEQQFVANLQRVDVSVLRQVERQMQQIGAAHPRKTEDLTRATASILAAQVVAKLVAAIALMRGAIERAALTKSEPTLAWALLARQNAKALKRAAIDVAYQFEVGTATNLYESAGVRYAIWRTRRDSRVRASHKEREGQIYELTKGLRGIKPGQEPGCRCVPIPLPPSYRR